MQVDSDAGLSKVMNDLAERVFSKILSDKIVSDCAVDILGYDSVTYYHSVRVCNLAIRLGSICFLSEEDLEVLCKASLLHDYGKMTIPKEVLNKPGKLTSDEYSIMKTHVLNGVKLLSEKGVDSRVIKIVGEHHENVHGGGYPYGLMGDQISVQGKILAITDRFDAITVKRIYQKKSLTIKDALKLLRSTDVDSEILKVFILGIDNF